MTWFDSAACKNRPDLSWFPQGDRRSPEYRRTMAQLKAVCAGCPVAAECRDAGRGEEHGVWSGQDELERGFRRRFAVVAA